LVQGIRATLGGIPHFVEAGFGACKIVSPLREFGDRDKGRKFELHYVDSPRPGEGQMEAFVGQPEVAQA
jgi:hypothetical protein